jgi:hypothetical protein
LKGSFVKSLAVSFTGNNLWLSTPYNGFDPEASDAISGDLTASSQAGFTYPQLRSYLFTINATF